MTHKSVRAQPVEAWARVIHDLMYLAPPEKRRKILERVLEIGESDNPAPVFGADIRSDAARTRAKMRIKSAIIYSFIRTIVNSNSPEQAAQLLFQRHNRVAGCGALDAYLDVLPNKYIRVDRPKIANLEIRTTATPRRPTGAGGGEELGRVGDVESGTSPRSAGVGSQVD
jgi:hypothetical protein